MSIRKRRPPLTEESPGCLSVHLPHVDGDHVSSIVNFSSTITVAVIWNCLSCSNIAEVLYSQCVCECLHRLLPLRIVVVFVRRTVFLVLFFASFCKEFWVNHVSDISLCLATVYNHCLLGAPCLLHNEHITSHQTVFVYNAKAITCACIASIPSRFYHHEVNGSLASSLLAWPVTHSRWCSATSSYVQHQCIDTCSLHSVWRLFVCECWQPSTSSEDYCL